MKNKKKPEGGPLECGTAYMGAPFLLIRFCSLPALWSAPRLFKIQGCSLTPQLTGPDCLGSAFIHQQVLREKRAATDRLQSLAARGFCINKSLKWANQKPQLLSPDSLLEYLGKLTLAVFLRDKAHKDQGREKSHCYHRRYNLERHLIEEIQLSLKIFYVTW